MESKEAFGQQKKAMINSGKNAYSGGRQHEI